MCMDVRHHLCVLSYICMYNICIYIYIYVYMFSMPLFDHEIKAYVYGCASSPVCFIIYMYV